MNLINSPDYEAGEDMDNAKKVPTVAIIGGGHNGLTCAAYLAKAGFEVSVFEKRDILGGLCVTEAPFSKAPGLKISSVASYYGMLRAEVVKELGLEKNGLRPYLSNPIEIVLLEKGQFVFTPRDQDGGEAQTKVDDLSEADQIGWQNFWTDIQKAAAIVYPYYLKPGLTQARLVDLLKEAGLNVLAERVFSASLFDLLDQYLKNDNLKAVAATCTPGFASTAGSVFGCIHHGTASTRGEFGAWGQVFGGMGEITAALADVALQNDARLYCDRPVQAIRIEKDKAVGLVFEDGEVADFDIIISALDPYVLFEKLLPAESLAKCAAITTHLSKHRPQVSAAKLHFLLKDLPSIETLTAIKHNHKGVIVIAPPKAAVEKAALQVPAGGMPNDLMLTMAFPTLEDPSMKGSEEDKRQVLTVDVHYLPARINGLAWQESDDQELLEATIAAIESQCPQIRDYILESYVVSPRALKERYNVESMSCWHLPMTPEYIFEKRSLPGCDHYETPFESLYLCSAGTYPGGNVTAAPGHNLAKKIIAKYQGNPTETESKDAPVLANSGVQL
ncbi:MAG: NAD(P)/FAD-dependent oxidoreductase [Cyanobacteria bacterium REEB67]|nr:NAD(P)/FAD-dependent oxidoreductase [Cyanobacteria bacterium REEB67]